MTLAKRASSSITTRWTNWWSRPRKSPMKESTTASAAVSSTVGFGKVLSRISKIAVKPSQTAEKLTVSRDNSLERTPPSIEADMNS
jgi:hypothetical protein